MKNILNNKKGMTPRNWILIAVLISMVFISTQVWIDGWSDIYYQNDSAYNLSQYDYISETRSNLESMENKIKSEGESSTLGLLDFVIKGAYQSILIVLSIPKLMYGMIGDLSAEYGIPTAIKNGFIVLMISALIFGILGTLFRKKT